MLVQWMRVWHSFSLMKLIQECLLNWLDLQPMVLQTVRVMMRNKLIRHLHNKVVDIQSEWIIMSWCTHFSNETLVPFTSYTILTSHMQWPNRDFLYDCITSHVLYACLAINYHRQRFLNACRTAGTHACIIVDMYIYKSVVFCRYWLSTNWGICYSEQWP